MSKFVKHFLFAIISALIVLSSALVCTFSVDVKAEEIDAANSQSAARGIYTSLSVDLKTRGSEVMLTLKNEITILPSTVRVRAELYSSLTYTSDYEDMTLVGYAYTADLDMGDSLTATASTEGVTKYWLGRVEYKIDNKNWVTELTSIYKISGDGEYIE